MLRIIWIAAAFAVLAGCARKPADEGRVTLKSSESSVSLHPAATLPAWIPVYAATQPQGIFSSDTREETRHTFSFESADPPAKIAAFYEDRLKSNGFTVQPLGHPEAGGLLSGETANKKRSVVVTIVPVNHVTRASVMAIEKK
jgi:hypothetical protein